MDPEISPAILEQLSHPPRYYWVLRDIRREDIVRFYTPLYPNKGWLFVFSSRTRAEKLILSDEYWNLDLDDLELVQVIYADILEDCKQPTFVEGVGVVPTAGVYLDLDTFVSLQYDLNNSRRTM